MLAIPHPIPYQGSKRSLAKLILQYFPHNTARLIEPFAGSAAVSLAALAHQKVKEVVLSDTDAALVALWNRIIQNPEALATEYSALWHAQHGHDPDHYNFVRSQFNQSHQPELFLYLLTRCVKAAVRYNARGDFNQSPDKRRKGTHPNTMRQSLLNASALLKNRASVACIDYRDALIQARPEDIVYLDPPYQGVCNTRDPRYKSKVMFDDFVLSLETLNEWHICYIVSYDGRTGTKTYGQPLPPSLNLTHIEIDAGRSSQATLLGLADRTIESLYLSSALIERIDYNSLGANHSLQYSLPGL